MTPETVRVFVGCDPNDCDLEQMMVLEHSLRKRASLPVDICWMRLSRDRRSPWYSDPGASGEGWQTQRWATPFSGFRWAVPHCCGFEGRAIYMDADMIVLCDIAELWRQPIEPPAAFIARKEAGFQRFCVMLWDCAAARELLPSFDSMRADPALHLRLLSWFAQHPRHVQAMDPAYNNIDGEHQPIERIRILHYSDMRTQFSHPRALERLRHEGRAHWFDGKTLEHPRRDLAALFQAEYEQALAAGRHPDQYRAPLFGDFPKKSERGHKGNAVTRSQLWLRRIGFGP